MKIVVWKIISSAPKGQFFELCRWFFLHFFRWKFFWSFQMNIFVELFQMNIFLKFSNEHFFELFQMNIFFELFKWTFFYFPDELFLNFSNEFFFELSRLTFFNFRPRNSIRRGCMCPSMCELCYNFCTFSRDGASRRRYKTGSFSIVTKTRSHFFRIKPNGRIGEKAQPGRSRLVHEFNAIFLTKRKSWASWRYKNYMKKLTPGRYPKQK